MEPETGAKQFAEMLASLTAERDALLAEKRTRRETDEQVMAAVNDEWESLRAERVALKAELAREKACHQQTGKELRDAGVCAGSMRAKERALVAERDCAFERGAMAQASKENDLRDALNEARKERDALKAELFTASSVIASMAGQLASAESARDQAVEKLGNALHVAACAEKRGLEVAQGFKFQRARAESAEQAIRALRERVGYLCDAIDAALSYHRRPKGGMQVSFHGDFASAPPSVLGRLEWWARDLRSVMPKEE